MVKQASRNRRAFYSGGLPAASSCFTAMRRDEQSCNFTACCIFGARIASVQITSSCVASFVSSLPPSIFNFTLTFACIFGLPSLFFDSVLQFGGPRILEVKSGKAGWTWVGSLDATATLGSPPSMLPCSARVAACSASVAAARRWPPSLTQAATTAAAAEVASAFQSLGDRLQLNQESGTVQPALRHAVP